MNSTLSKILIFAAGAGIGSFVAWKITKSRYEEIVKEELESIREAYREKRESDNSRIEKLEEVSNYIKEGFETGLNNPKPDLFEYANILKEEGYSENQDNTDKKADLVLAGPYVIAPEEFDELDDYEAVSLTYYEDGVVAHFDGEIVDNFEELIGDDALESFGEYEEDAVFVRNNQLKTDYEILKDYRRYEDVYPSDDE